MIVKSFRLAAIPEVRHHLIGVKTAALFSPKIMDYLRRRKYMLVLAHEFGADQISLHRSLATRGLGRRAAEANMPLTVWTVDDPKWIGRCHKFGIGALITNDPAGMIAARTSERDVASRIDSE
jgi:glycerophosphoryl diester phosphodiesterase